MYQYVTHFTLHDLIYMIQGAGVTLLLTIASGSLGTLIGFLVGWGRSTNSRILYYVLGCYIDIFRSVPLIIQFVLFNSFMAIAGYPLNPFLSGLITLSLYISGYVSEVVKAGIESVPKTTRMAARGLGLKYLHEFFYIVLPIGVRTVFPSWVGLLLGLMKDTSLIAVLGATPPELLRSSQIIITRIQQPLLVLLGAGVFYFVLCHLITKLSERYEMRWQQR